MLFDTQTVPTRRELLIDLAAFGGTVVVAVVQDWKTSDIVWASWTTSLLLGLSFFLAMSLKMLRDYTLAIPRVEQDTGVEMPGGTIRMEDSATGEGEEGNADAPAPMDSNPGCLGVAVGGLMVLLAWLAGTGPIRVALIVLVGLNVFALVISILAPRGWFGVSLRRPWGRAFFYLPTALYMFFFFLMHFGGFHLGHAVFLSFFVPPEVELAVVTDSMSGIHGALVGIREAAVGFAGGLILTYWPYIASVALKSVGAFRAALGGDSRPKDVMLLPYRNVIRLHLLIFALIPLAAFGSGLVMTIGVLFFFFFPVESVVAWLKSR